ncbi:MAG: MFS transporter [Gammaproteobacteria bacterium]|nr:MFS transporter [Gammaproteobacteria bacterium]
MNKMKINVWLLSFCQALMNTGNVLLVATSSLVGYQLAADKSLATLPLGVQFFATMLTTIPASMLMKQIGRRHGFMLGTLLGIGGAGLGAWSIAQMNFWYFCISTALVGAFNGFGTFYRFAAADVASSDYRPTAISYVMAGGVIAAVVGPNLANWTRGLFAATQFTGSYIALAGLYLLSFLALVVLSIPPPTVDEARSAGRPLPQIARQAAYVVAALGAALGYGIMALVMTATPLAMHHHAHLFDDTTFVIEWHVLGMFAPSFVTGHLIRRLGVLNIMLTGAVLSGLCVVVNLLGTDLLHFWVALLLLGIGWNFLFVGGSTLLTETYHIDEKAKAQALNDFLVFALVTASSLSAGVLQYQYGWKAINIGVLPLIFLVFFSVAWLKQHRREAS